MSFPEKQWSEALTSPGDTGVPRQLSGRQFSWICDYDMCTDDPYLASEQDSSPSSNKALTQPHLWVNGTFQGGILAVRQNSDGRFI